MPINITQANVYQIDLHQEREIIWRDWLFLFLIFHALVENREITPGASYESGSIMVKFCDRNFPILQNTNNANKGTRMVAKRISVACSLFNPDLIFC